TRSLDIFRRYSLPCKAADGLHEWGLALARAGDPSAAEKLNAALDIYAGHEAGQALCERVERDRAAL
ncbi:MAG: hypothetical protein M3331_01220, partial [Actinomycetota bacterium]|nr:hypothetical protein [Actinomycetota bacterium]